MVERFERIFAERVGARHAVAVSSGTAALHVACLAAGLDADGYALTSPITFSATANAVVYCSAEVGLADINAGSLGLDPAAVARAKTPRGRLDALLPVHLAGLADDMGPLRTAAAQSVIIEDASHALGGVYPSGRPVGCGEASDMTVFSFHPVKPITSGEGGMVATNDDGLAQRLRLLRNHGIERDPANFLDPAQARPDGAAVAPWYQEQQLLGFNYRMSDIHAALGLSQLGKLDRFLARRREIAARYDAAFADVPGLAIYQAGADSRARSALHLYVLGFDFAELGTTRTELMLRLKEQGIGSQVHYLPIYRHPYYRARLGDVSARFPAAEEYYARSLSIPFFHGMRDNEVERVVSAVTETCGG